MITIGRATASIGLSVTAITIMLLSVGVRGGADQPNGLDYVVAGALVLALFSWLLAIWHWAFRFNVPGTARVLWGLVVVFGLPIGAAIYWLVLPGAERPEKRAT